MSEMRSMLGPWQRQGKAACWLGCGQIHASLRLQILVRLVLLLILVLLLTRASVSVSMSVGRRSRPRAGSGLCWRFPLPQPVVPIHGTIATQIDFHHP